MKPSQELDGIDIKLIKQLVKNAKLSAAELSKKLNIPQSTVYFRIRRLEKLGVIEGYSARISRSSLGLGLLALVEVMVETDSDPKALYRDYEKIPGITSVYSTAGDVDGVIILAAPSLDALNERMMEIRHIKGIRESKTLIVMNTLKENMLVLE